MKRCGACGEEFQDQFKFCPVDGAVLVGGRETGGFNYSPTIISDESLISRLSVQIQFLIPLLSVAWPQFKADPVTFLKAQTRQAIALVRSGSSRPYFKRALAASVTVVTL